MNQFSRSTLARFERQRDFMRVAPRVLPITPEFPTTSKADVKAARNLLYLDSKGKLPGYEPVFNGLDENGNTLIAKRPFELGPRYTTVITNDNLRRERQKADLAQHRKASLLLLNPTIKR